jgi:hypothetical protein
MSVVGSASPATGLVNTYTLNQLPESSGLKVRAGTAATGSWTEGAEDSPVPKIIDGTTTGYVLRASPASFASPGNFPAFAGTKVFHLAFGSNPAVTQSFTLDHFVIPTATSHLQFKNRFHFLTLTSALNAEISTDDGSSWSNLWKRSGDANSSSGSSGTWETSWQTGDVLIPASYAGKIVRLRFILTQTDSYNVGTSGNFGAFVDGITLTNSQEFTPLSTSDLSGTATTYNFTPPSNGTYLLQAQMEMGDTHYFDWGSITSVTAVTLTALQNWRNTNLGSAVNAGPAADAADPDGDGLQNVVEYAFGLNPNVAQSRPANYPTISKSGNNINFTFTPAATAVGLTYTVQQSASLASGSWTNVTTFNAGGLYTASVPITGARIFLRLKVDNISGL